MSLDVTKLENVREKRGKTTARCPACAKKGQDHSGDHLVIYPDGAYGCVAHEGDEAHRREIFDLVGIADGGKRKIRPIPVPIRRPGCVNSKSRTSRTLVLNFLAYGDREKEFTPLKESSTNPSETSEPAENGTPGEGL
jgi:hypothetical protein